MKKVNLHEIQEIQYTKGTEVTQRIIIPMIKPQPNIKAIDVTDLPENEQHLIAQHIGDYHEYVELHQSKIYDFETWCEHQNIQSAPLKWRTFKPEHTEIL